jgi:hypothetical protein
MKRLFMVIAVLLTAAALPAQVGAVLGGGQAIVVVEDRPFAPAVQLLSEIDAGLIVVFNNWDLSIGLGIAYLAPSALTGSGITYRGVVTRTLWVRSRIELDRRFSAAFAARASLATYELTPLLFFYPEARVGLDLTPAAHTGSPVHFQLWTGYQFRQDLSVSFALGIGTRIDLVTGE